MYNLNKKQKIIIATIVTIISITICYFVSAKESQSPEELEEILKVENQNKEETIQNQETEEKIIIHIAGCIKKEGILELKVNSRIMDAIEKAGGLTEEANLENINLASILEDGMKIYIPNKNEKQEETHNTENNNKNTIPTKESKQENSINKVNINTATQTQLETLPGIGPSTAQKIIQYRKEKGKFSKKEDIKEVSGIGEAKYNKIKEYIIVK